MKLFRKILFWVYFAIASIALLIVIVYLVRGYQTFSEEKKYEQQVNDFSRYFQGFEKDSSFVSLFNQEPTQAIDFINSYESYFGYADFKSGPASMNSADISALQNLIINWPARYQEIFKENLLAIYILDTARFNGLTQIIPSTSNRFIIYLNAKIFRTAPNEWITQESTKSLLDDYKDKVKFILYDEKDNSPIRTAEHVLLHEVSHIISFLEGEAPMPDGTFFDKQGYFPLIETCYDEGNIHFNSENAFTKEFSLLSNKYPGEKTKLDLISFKELNEELLSSPFPTPYSTSHPAELVAEILTMYVHQYHQGHKYLAIFNNTDTIHFAQKLDTAYIRRIVDGY